MAATAFSLDTTELKDPDPVQESRRPGVRKALTGISGLDEVTGGGLPAGRPSLVCGPAGCGKTLLAMQFLVRGIIDYDEPGVFVAFEESTQDLVDNVASLGFDLTQLESDGKLVVDHIALSTGEMHETGAWDLEGLFIRLAADMAEVGAKRIVLDTIETLFGAFDDAATLRAELGRLFVWLKSQGVTAVITGERGDGTLTRNGIEEYVSDCVIVLDHRVSEQTSTRRLRVMKYRGSLHGTNEYPFLIGRNGLAVMPITSLGLDHDASGERVLTGIPALDQMLGGSGLYRGSSVMVSGTAGTGKSTLAAQFCAAACERGEKTLYFGFEESAAQITRNMLSVGIDLQPWVDRGLLEFRCVRPSLLGLEAHLAAMWEMIAEIEPHLVVMDPISDLLGQIGSREVSAMLTRQVDFLKTRGVTGIFTSLSSRGLNQDSEQQIGSLIDTWIVTDLLEIEGSHKRLITVLKSRGMAHSHEVHEFDLGHDGIQISGNYRKAGGPA